MRLIRLISASSNATEGPCSPAATIDRSSQGAGRSSVVGQNQRCTAYGKQRSAWIKGSPLVRAAASGQCKHVVVGGGRRAHGWSIGRQRAPRGQAGDDAKPAAAPPPSTSCLPCSFTVQPASASKGGGVALAPLPPASCRLQLLEQAARLACLRRRLLLCRLKLLHLLHRRLERGGGLVNQAPRLARLLQQRGRSLLSLPAHKRR